MPKIAVVGDVLLDRYDYCTFKDNPESSAQLCIVRDTKFKPGGAGNVTANLRTLGSDVQLFSVIGQDEAGSQLEALLGNVAQLVRIKGRETIVKQRLMGLKDSLYLKRIDYGEKEPEDVRVVHYDDVDVLLDKLYGFAPEGIVVSDYDKGLITSAMMPPLLEYVRAKAIPLFVDPKPNHKKLYAGVFMITPNVKEARLMGGLDDELACAAKLVEELDTRILLTRSEQGMSYFSSDERFDLPAETHDICDVTGAGDTVIATLVHFYLKGVGLRRSIELANKAAGIAVCHPGCYQVSEKEVLG